MITMFGKEKTVEPKFDVGDLIELIPSAFDGDWMEGKGLIVGIEDNNYIIEMFVLSKTMRKNLALIDFGPSRLNLPVDKADEKGYFKEITN